MKPAYSPAVMRIAFSVGRGWDGTRNTEPLRGGCTINLYLSVPLLISVALVQSVVLSRVSLWGARPDLMMLVVLAWAAVRGVDEAVVWGFIGGLIMDLLSGGPPGTMVLALLAAAWLVGQPWGQGLGLPALRLVLLAFVGVIVYHLILLAALAWSGRAVDWGGAILQVAGPSALLNALLAPFVQRPLGWLERKTRREGFAL